MSDHKAVVRKIVEDHWNNKKPDMAGDLFASGCVIHTPDAKLQALKAPSNCSLPTAALFPTFI